MGSIDVASVRQFVEPLVAERDCMHDMTHLDRVAARALTLCRRRRGCLEIALVASYLHSTYQDFGTLLVEFLDSKGVKNTKREAIFEAASGGSHSAVPRSLAGKIVHDANLVESNAEAFLFAKYLCTGAARGCTFQEIVAYAIAELRAPNARCAFRDSQSVHNRQRDFARLHFEELLKSCVAGPISDE